MTSIITTIITKFPRSFAMALLGFFPQIEFRVAFPVALKLGFAWPVAFFLVMLGNLLPIFLIYGLGNWWLAHIAKQKHVFGRITDWVVDHTRHKISKKYEKYGLFGLLIFVFLHGGAGAWTGTLAAFLLGIPLKKAFPTIVVGILLGALPVWGVALGISNLIKVL